MAERRTVLNGSAVFWLFLKFVLLGPALRLLFRPKVTGLEHIPREGARAGPARMPTPRVAGDRNRTAARQ